MAKNITFKEARDSTQLRQSYLDQVMKLCPESVQALIYDPKGSQRIEYEDRLVAEGHLDKYKIEESRANIEGAMFVVIYSQSLVGSGRSHPIFVRESGFKKIDHKSPFLSSILDHEASHTDDLMYGIRLPGLLINQENTSQISETMLMFLREVIAYRKQFYNLHKRGIGESGFKHFLYWQLGAYEKELWSMTLKTDLERRVLEIV